MKTLNFRIPEAVVSVLESSYKSCAAGSMSTSLRPEGV